MEISTLVNVLDQPHLAADYLHDWGLSDVRRGQEILLELADTGLTLDLLAAICRQLAEHLPQTPDPDAALQAFRRFMSAVRSPLGLAALLDRDSTAMPMLLAALSLGPSWANSLVEDPEAFDLLRQTEGGAIDPADLLGEMLSEIDALGDERLVVADLARIRRRHLLRIAYAEIVGRQPLPFVLRQLSHLTDAIVEAASAAALRKAQEARPLPVSTLSKQLRWCVIGLGSWGGSEPSYASQLPLLVVYESLVDEATSQRMVKEHFDRAARLLQRFLAEGPASEAGSDVRLVGLPDSPLSAPAHAADDVVFGLDSFGRTWHRQEMLKARVVAGDRTLGVQLLSLLEPWLFRRYLEQADETGIRALKRRILLDATIHQDDWRNVRLARGGLGDMEATVEFLQLLAGGDQPAVRQKGTLEGLAGLQAAGIVTADERCLLEDTYAVLRRLQHRLQILLGSDEGAIPVDPVLAERVVRDLELPLDAAGLTTELRRRLSAAWNVLEKLLTSAFAEDPPAAREVDLLLNPAPPPEEVRAALAPFGFCEPEQALATLNDLASEQVPFLSTRRCRHSLALILPQLLCAVGATPNPDRTLDSLARVSNSLGGKGVLWELLGANPPSLDLYVKLCAASPLLSDVLTTNPGMIDELIDSLQLDKLPTRDELDATLAELCRGAADTLPIVHDFKNAEQLRIGVRDLLGHEAIDRTHEALSDVAEACLSHVTQLEYERLVEKHGEPRIGKGPTEGQPSHFVMIGLGKLGGRELNYQSHLDVLFLYEDEGVTRPIERWRRVESTANNHFFTQLAQRIIKQLSQHTPKGRLYAIDALLRPIGVGGALALSFADFAQHFASGIAPMWQWQSLCQARPVFGDAAACERAAALVRQLLVERPRRDSDVAELRRSRMALERDASPQNLKRGRGGTLDIEFLVQMLQLRDAAAARPEVLTTNTQAALTALGTSGILSAQMAGRLSESYRFLRRVESTLHLLGAVRRQDLPSDTQELGRLAFLLGHGNPDRLLQQCLDFLAQNRAAFEELTR